MEKRTLVQAKELVNSSFPTIFSKGLRPKNQYRGQRRGSNRYFIDRKNHK